MSEYTLSEIRPTNKRDVRKMDALLEKEGIQRDKNLDYSIGLFDDDYNLVATGSCFKNTLRCMAVDSNHQGEGLLNQVVTHLMDHQYSRGNVELFQMCIRDRLFTSTAFMLLSFFCLIFRLFSSPHCSSGAKRKTDRIKIRPASFA